MGNLGKISSIFGKMLYLCHEKRLNNEDGANAKIESRKACRCLADAI